jgi:hypothetical protein
MRALYISAVVMAALVACQAQDDNRIYAIGSKGITPPKVISTVQPAVAEPKKQVPASEQKTGAGDQNSAPNNTDQKSPETAPGVNTGKLSRAELSRDEMSREKLSREKMSQEKMSRQKMSPQKRSLGSPGRKRSPHTPA